MAVLSSGCATFEVQRQKADAVKKVAIIGFSGVPTLDDHDDSRANTVASVVGTAQDVSSGEMQRRRQSQAETTWALLTQQLHAHAGWQVSDRAALRDDAGYQALLAAHPHGDDWLVAHVQRLPDVLRADEAEQLDAKQRAELCRRLGVDAVAVVKLRYEVMSSSHLGFGPLGTTTLHPRATIEFVLRDGSDQPLWRDTGATGVESAEGLTRSMGRPDGESETRAFTAAASSAISALLERYRSL